MKEQSASHNLKCEEMCGKDSPLNEKSHDEPGVELYSDMDGVEMGYHNDDGSILAKRDIHPSERNEVVIVPTSNITIASCDDPGGRSKKENGELVINDMRYWNTDRLTMKRPKVNRVGLRYHNEGWITIYEWDAHPPESKTEYETEGGTMFKQYYRKKDTTVGMPINHQDDGDKVVLVPTNVVTIYGDAHGLTDGRPNASEGGLECHENGGTITDNPPDEGKMEDETKGGTVVINARKLWAPG
ncbi:14867_t:CDS:2, partial [Acaulospora morrowiae]